MFQETIPMEVVSLTFAERCTTFVQPAQAWKIPAASCMRCARGYLVYPHGRVLTCTIMPFYMIILCAFRKLLKSADTLFCGAFWKYLQKYVLDVTGHQCPMLHPQQLFFEIYTSTSMIPAIAKTYMVAVCYVDGSMRQNFE